MTELQSTGTGQDNLQCCLSVECHMSVESVAVLTLQ